MDCLLEGTPIAFVKQADIDIKVDCDIHPIHIKYKNSLLEFFKQDEFFEYGEIELISYFQRITNIQYRFKNGWIDLAEHINEAEDKINQLIDRFASVNKGYINIQA
jgi:hypothetical protein